MSVWHESIHSMIVMKFMELPRWFLVKSLLCLDRFIYIHIQMLRSIIPSYFIFFLLNVFYSPLFLIDSSFRHLQMFYFFSSSSFYGFCSYNWIVSLTEWLNKNGIEMLLKIITSTIPSFSHPHADEKKRKEKNVIYNQIRLFRFSPFIIIRIILDFPFLI